MLLNDVLANIIKPYVSDTIQEQLHECCARGDLSGALWLAATFNLTIIDFNAAPARGPPTNSHLPPAQWLADHTSASDDVSIFRRACVCGHLLIALWTAEHQPTKAAGRTCTQDTRLLTQHFKLTTSDVRAVASTGFYWACVNGHLHTAQWLAMRFSLTTADVCGGSPLRHMCSGGHHQVAQWLSRRFDLNFRNAGPRDRCAHYYGCGGC